MIFFSDLAKTMNPSFDGVIHAQPPLSILCILYSGGVFSQGGG